MAHANRSFAVTDDLWSWRDKILRSSLRPEVRLVLLAVSSRMQDTTDCIFPTLSKIVADTGLATEAVRAGLREAAEAGFLEVLEIEPGYFQVTRRS